MSKTRDLYQRRIAELSRQIRKRQEAIDSHREAIKPLVSEMKDLVRSLRKMNGSAAPTQGKNRGAETPEDLISNRFQGWRPIQCFYVLFEEAGRRGMTDEELIQGCIAGGQTGDNVLFVRNGPDRAFRVNVKFGNLELKAGLYHLTEKGRQIGLTKVESVPDFPWLKKR